MKFLILFLIASLATACTHQKEFRLREPASEPTRGLRVYMQIQNCEFVNPKIIKFLAVPFPVSMHPKYSDKESLANGLIGIEAQLKNGAIVKNYAPNPYLVDHEKTGKTVSSCQAFFFIDLPQVYTPTEISSLNLIYTDRAVTREKAFPLKMPEQIVLEKFDPSRPIKTINYPSGAGEKYRIVKIHGNAPADSAWDLVFLGDGFSAKELSLNSDEEVLTSTLGKAAKELTEHLFRYEPFKSLQDRINVKLVATISAQSGIPKASDPQENKTFYSSVMGQSCIDRSFMVGNAERALEMGFLAQADSILTIFNTQEYGGQGSFISSASLNPNNKKIFIHELGHSLGGLSDGYSYSVRSITTANPKEMTIEQKCEVKKTSQTVHDENSANQYQWPDEYLSFNIARTPEIAKQKWGYRGDILRPHFPSVAEVKEGSSPDKLALYLKFERLTVPTLYLTGLASQDLNDARTLQMLSVNGVPGTSFQIKTIEVPTIDGMKSFNYLVVPRPSSGILEIVLELPKKHEAYLHYFARPSNTGFQLLDRPVHPLEIVPVEMDRGDVVVYRSSLSSLMTGEPYPGNDFDVVEKAALKHRLCAYIKDRAKVQACSF